MPPPITVKPLTRSQKAYITMYGERRSAYTIAKELGLSMYQVEKYLSELQLEQAMKPKVDESYYSTKDGFFDEIKYAKLAII